jgi:hypothetical protein
MEFATGLANAFVISMAMLVEEIETKGTVSRAEFAAKLRSTADNAERAATGLLKEAKRFDLVIIRNLADNLAPAPGQTGWKPVVIEGGKGDGE